MHREAQISPQNKSKNSEFKKVLCRFCKSENITKRGKRKTDNRGLIQRYGCQNCNKRFVIDDGFFKMKNALSNNLILERSSQYWYKRYFKHPSKRYECLKLSSITHGEMGGIVFLIHTNEIEIIDLIYTKKTDVSKLLNALERHAFNLNIPKLKAWGTESFINDLADGNKEHVGWLALPHPSIGAPITADVINKCWLSAGDSDFK